MISAHPLAEVFPPMSDDEFAALVEDIREHGVREPLVIYEGMVLDGRHRARACDSLEIEPPVREYEGDDPLAFVISTNLHRRHLNTSQRAMVAASIAKLRDGQRPDRVAAENSAPTQAQAAKLLNVSRHSAQFARVVQERGVPELVEEVKAGRLGVAPARSLARQEPEAQRAALAARGEAKRERVERKTGKLTETQRQREIAHVAHRRLVSICSWLDGMVAGLPRLRVEAALAVASKSDVEQFCESLSAGASALRRLLAQVKESAK